MYTQSIHVIVFVNSARCIMYIVHNMYTVYIVYFDRVVQGVQRTEFIVCGPSVEGVTLSTWNRQLVTTLLKFPDDHLESTARVQRLTTGIRT